MPYVWRKDDLVWTRRIGLYKLWFSGAGTYDFWAISCYLVILMTSSNQLESDKKLF